MRTGEPIFKFAVGERVKVWLPGKRSGQVGMIKEAKKKVPVPFSLEAENLAEELVKHVPLPEKAKVDALHIAIATVNGMDYLLTWNCTHIANAAFQHRIEAICRFAGFDPPTICTPQQLMEA